MQFIPVAKPQIDQQEIKAVSSLMETGNLAQGATVREFEKGFSEHFGYSGSAAVCNGTAALHVALMAAGVKAGDIVLTTPFTFVATSNAVLYCGAIPLYADIDENTFNISPDSLRELAESYPEARFLLIVHLFGQSCDMEGIMKVANEYNLVIIEDCAQAHGASYNAKPVGTFGCGGTFSFYPTKNMSTGEGGMIASEYTDFLEECHLLINHGARVRYVHETLGFNYRMTNIAAAIGIEQLKKVSEMNERRRFNAAYYFSNIINSNISLPYVDPQGLHVFHQFTLKVENRDVFVKYLESNQIGSGIYYPVPVHKQKHIQLHIEENGYNQPSCPVAEKISSLVVSIPVHPALHIAELKHITKVINKYENVW